MIIEAKFLCTFLLIMIVGYSFYKSPCEDKYQKINLVFGLAMVVGLFGVIATILYCIWE